MATSSYLARVIYKKAGDSNYKLLCPAKTIGTPIGTPNNIETTTLEDGTQTFIEGIKTSDAIAISANLDNDLYTSINALKGQKLEFIFLYGSDGVGGALKVKRGGTVTVTPNEVGGTDTVLEMTVTITPNTDAEVIDATVSTDDGVNFTVA